MVILLYKLEVNLLLFLILSKKKRKTYFRVLEILHKNAFPSYTIFNDYFYYYLEIYKRKKR